MSEDDTDAITRTEVGSSPRPSDADRTARVPGGLIARLSEASSQGDTTARDGAGPFPPALRETYTDVVEFARGGIGRVARAFDQRLSRVVALKVLQGASRMDERRFAREVRVTARLQHPGIVPIYEAGRWPDGEPFYAMKLISGDSLSTRVKRASSLAERLRLVRCVENVADSMAYAHAQGVIHRDLKPSNVVVGEFGETVVIDWGLAKILRASTGDGRSMGAISDGNELDSVDSGDGHGVLPGAGRAHELAAHPDTDVECPPASDPLALTMVGDVLGTVYFMSPEQALGFHVDERTDIWAIGAILYNVIAAVPPFSDTGDDEPLELVGRGHPTPLRHLVPDAPVELVDIVERAMSVMPEARYASMREIADDLRRFQLGELVSAHHYTWSERVGRRLRRRALPLAVVAVAALLLGAMGVAAALRVGRERDRAEARRIEAVAAGEAAVRSRLVAVREQDELLLVQARSQLDTDPTASIAALKRLSPDWTAWARVRDIALEAHLRGVATLMPGHAGDVWAIEITPDGSAAITASVDRTLRIWDLREGRSRVLATTPEPQVVIALDRTTRDLVDRGRARWLYSAGLDRKVHRWSLSTDPPVDEVLGEQAAIIVALALSPDGSTLASGSAEGEVILWDLRSIPPRRASVRDQKDTVYSLGFSPDSSTLASIGADGMLRLRDVVSRKAIEIPAHQGRAFTLAFSSRGEIATGGSDGTVNVFSPTSSAPVSTSAWKKRQIASARGTLFTVAFSADGSRIVAGGDDRRVVVEDLETSTRVVLRGHQGIHTAAFLPSGELLTSGDDWTLRRWPAEPDGIELVSVAPVRALSPTQPDGSVFVGLSSGVVARLNRRARTFHEIANGPSSVTALDAKGDGALVAIGRENGRITLVEAHEAAVDLPGPERPVTRIAISPDTSRVAEVREDGVVRVWTRATREVRTYPIATSALYGVAWQDDESVVVCGWDRHVRALDLRGGHLRELGVHDDWARAVAISADRSFVASGGVDHTLRLWPNGPQDAGKNEPRALLGHSARVESIVLVDDDRVLLSASKDRTVRRWRVESGELLATRAFPAAVRELSSDASGAVVSATAGDTLYQWRESVPWGDALRAWLSSETNVILDDQGTLSVTVQGKQGEDVGGTSRPSVEAPQLR